MAGWIGSGRRRLVLAGVAAAVAAASTPMPGRAADQDGVVLLPGSTLAAVTADIDDDEAAELVRLVDLETGRSIEVWDVVDGTWSLVLATATDTLLGPIDDTEFGFAPLAIVRTIADGRERALFLATDWDERTGAMACCLTVHELTSGVDGIAWRAMPSPEVPVEAVIAVDLDADGTDELLTSIYAWPTEPGEEVRTTFDVLRRVDGAWVSTGAWQEDGSWYPVGPVETDGLPGGEVLVTGDGSGVMRIGWVDGARSVEVSSLGHFPDAGAWIAGAIDGALAVVVPEMLALVEWPHGEGTRVAASRPAVGYPSVGTVSGDAGALLLVQEGFDLGATVPSTTVLDRQLDPVASIEPRPEAIALWELLNRSLHGRGAGLERNLWPYTGPVTGDWIGGGAAYVVAGTLVTQAAGGAAETTPIATLVGALIGVVGPEDGWVVVGDVYGSTNQRMTYLQYGTPFGTTPTAIVPIEQILHPAGPESVGEVRLERGIEIGDEDGVATVLASPDGLDLVVTAPPGTVAITWDGTSVIDHGEVDDALRITIPPPRDPERDSFARDLVLIAPSGAVAVHRWIGTFAIGGPDLTLRVEAELMSLQATVVGRVSERSTVTVDGAPVAVNRFGAYRATVDAPIWPRDVVVVARDPFGVERMETIQIVGLVDYRGLPWVPIAAGLTLLAGVGLFLRTPRHRPSGLPVLEGDGLLEELDGDAR